MVGYPSFSKRIRFNKSKESLACFGTLLLKTLLCAGVLVGVAPLPVAPTGLAVVVAMLDVVFR